jgi:hypothetical protein
MSYANIMARSCGEEEEEGGDEEEGEPPSLQEQEIEKMKLLFNQVTKIDHSTLLRVNIDRVHHFEKLSSYY